MKTNRVARFLALLAVVTITAVLGISFFNWVLPGPRMQRLAKSMIGKPESEVLRTLGTPRYVLIANDLKGRTVDFPWKGMKFVPVPDRPIRKKVLLYSEMSWAAYIYIDEHGIVEHVATAAT